jgi:hypothetical protein
MEEKAEAATMGERVAAWTLGLKTAEQANSDRHRRTHDMKQYMAPAVGTQLDELSHIQILHICPIA